jgi:hypothetical protein
VGRGPISSAMVTGGSAVIDRAPGVRRRLVRLVG